MTQKDKVNVKVITGLLLTTVILLIINIVADHGETDAETVQSNNAPTYATSYRADAHPSGLPAVKAAAVMQPPEAVMQPTEAVITEVPYPEQDVSDAVTEAAVLAEEQEAPEETEAPEPVKDPAPGYTEEDLSLLAEVMYHENYSTGRTWEERCECMLLTGSVVLNRRDHCSWCPDTIKGVLYQDGQYATTGKFFTVDIPESVYGLAKQLLEEGSIAPEGVVFQSMHIQGSSIYKVIEGEYFCWE